MKTCREAIFALVYGTGCAAISAMVFYGLHFELELNPTLSIISSAITLTFTIFFGKEKFEEGE